MMTNQIAIFRRSASLRFVRAGCWSIAALVFIACDSSNLVPSPPAMCAEFGTQCQLPDGPLGVCERFTCPKNTKPPCFQCTPQH